MLNQENNFEHSVLFISGDFSRLFFNRFIKGVGKEQILGMIASLTVRYPKTKIIQTYPLANSYNKNENQLIAELASKIVEKANDGKMLSPYKMELYKVKHDDLKMRLLLCFSGVGEKKAKKFLLDEKIAKDIENILEIMKAHKIYKGEKLE